MNAIAAAILIGVSVIFAILIVEAVYEYIKTVIEDWEMEEQQDAQDIRDGIASLADGGERVTVEELGEELKL